MSRSGSIKGALCQPVAAFMPTDCSKFMKCSVVVVAYGQAACISSVQKGGAL